MTSSLASRGRERFVGAQHAAPLLPPVSFPQTAARHVMPERSARNARVAKDLLVVGPHERPARLRSEHDAAHVASARSWTWWARSRSMRATTTSRCATASRVLDPQTPGGHAVLCLLDRPVSIAFACWDCEIRQRMKQRYAGEWETRRSSCKSRPFLHPRGIAWLGG